MSFAENIFNNVILSKQNTNYIQEDEVKEYLLDLQDTDLAIEEEEFASFFRDEGVYYLFDVFYEFLPGDMIVILKLIKKKIKKKEEAYLNIIDVLIQEILAGRISPQNVHTLVGDKKLSFIIRSYILYLKYKHNGWKYQGSEGEKANDNVQFVSFINNVVIPLMKHQINYLEKEEKDALLEAIEEAEEDIINLLDIDGSELTKKAENDTLFFQKKNKKGGLDY